MSILKASLGDGRERALLADPIANALITLPNNHSYIHKGQHFKAGASDEMLNAGQKLSISVATPGWVPVGNDSHDTAYHMVFRSWAHGPVSFGIYEDVTVISGGTVQTPMNNSRLSDHGYSTDLTITAGALTRTGGNLLLPLYYTGTATGGSSTKLSGFDSRDDDEILLKPESITVFELTSLDNIDFYAGVEIAWYEYVPEM